MSGADGARSAVAYIRLTKSDTPDAQRLAIEAWAEQTQVEVRSWQLDIVDGDTPIAERPGLLAAYAAIRDHRAGILVAANAERFAHDELVCWLIEHAALTQGAQIHTADGSRGPARAHGSAPKTDDAGWSRGTVDLARSYARVVLRSRVRAALAEKRARGERIGTIPYGYRLAADGIHVEPNEDEQAIVHAVRRLSAGGLSQRAIVAQLAAHGVAGRTGAPLRQTQIANILRAASASS